MYNHLEGNLAVCITSSKMYMLSDPAISPQNLGPEETIRQVYRDVCTQCCLYKWFIEYMWIQRSTNMIAYILCWIFLSHSSKTLSDIRKSSLIWNFRLLSSCTLPSSWLRLDHGKRHNLPFLSSPSYHFWFLPFPIFRDRRSNWEGGGQMLLYVRTIIDGFCMIGVQMLLKDHV